MTRLPIRTSLTLACIGILSVTLAALGIGFHFFLARQLDLDATESLAEMATGLHGYLRFADGVPVLVFDPSDPEAAAFVANVTRYYQVYDVRGGRLLTQSPGLAALGLHFTPEEVAEFTSVLELRDIQTDEGRLRLSSSLISPAPDESYVVQVGESLARVDDTIAGFDRVLAWGALAALVWTGMAGSWLARRALAPLSRLSAATQSIGITSLHERLAVRGTGDELDDVAEAFNRVLARLETSVGEMRQFSAALAHELRTPLAILRGETELALRQAGADDDLRLRLAGQIDEFDRLARLIGQILLLARAEAGEIALAAEPVDLAALATGVVEQVEPVAAARDITLTCNASDAVVATGDPGWLERLLLILLDNAIKFTPDGGRVWVSVDREGQLAILRVRDDGNGISAEVLPHVFERFYRAEAARSGPMSGAGLGLTLAKWIADRHHATIDVESQPGYGSMFIVRLPRRVDVVG